MFLTAIKPLLDVALSFEEDIHNMLNTLEATKTEDQEGDGLAQLAHGNI